MLQRDADDRGPRRRPLRVPGPSRDESTPFNPEEWGGFSLGGRDTSSAEFGDIVADVLPGGPYGPDFDLAQFPARMSVSGSVRVVDLFADSAAWTPYWEHLGFSMDVVSVASPGTLQVFAPGSGTWLTLPITAPGTYFADLGPHAPAPDVHVEMTCLAGLDMEIDCVGVPSLIPFDPTSVDEVTKPRLGILTAAPNPFNPRLEIAYRVPSDGPTRVTVVDARGRLVAVLFEGDLTEGRHETTWEGRTTTGRPAPSGTYLVRVEQHGASVARKVILAR